MTVPLDSMRVVLVEDGSPDAAATVAHLVQMAVSGLAGMYLGAGKGFPQTVRGLPTPRGPRVVPEGSSLRYTAIAALGLSRTGEDVQRRALQGQNAADLTRLVAARARDDADLGAVALAAWAAAEVNGQGDQHLIATLERRIGSNEALSTVGVSWALTAAVAAAQLADTSRLRWLATHRLLEAQGAQGIFPHALPASSLGRLRSHVACFADQVYPIQALSRASAMTSDPDALAAAELSAQRICGLQGVHGQWWWHYDARTGDVIERYPVYAVHQHAMAPMALFELRDHAGHDHTLSVTRGLQWLTLHPEVLSPLIDERLDVVWRKVGRREPSKASRKIAAVVTALRPGASLPGVDRLLPPGVVDHECRPYELGWLLYAWLAPDRRPDVPSRPPS